MEVRAARAHELDEIVDLMCLAYRPESRPRFENHLRADSSYRLDQSRVCIVDGKIVSYVRVSDRPIRIGKAVVRMGGIGGVSTHPEHRHRGYSTATLEDAIRYMEREGYDLSMLFTGIQPFYARLGWVPFPEHAFSMELRRTGFVKGQRPLEKSAYEVRAFSYDSDLNRVLSIYNAHNRTRTGTLVRSDRYWRDGHSQYMGVLPSLVAERERTTTVRGEIGAYAGISFHEHGIRIREMGYVEPEALAALVRALLRDAYDRKAKWIAGPLQRSHPMVELLSEEARSPLSHSLSEGMMLRGIRLRSIFEKIASELEDRLVRGGLERTTASVCFQVDGQRCPMRIEQGRIALGPEDREMVEVPLDARSFFKLLLGDSTIGQLREWNEARGVFLSSDVERLLEVLFPIQEPVYWVCDHF